MSAALWIDADRLGQLHASPEVVRAVLGSSGKPQGLSWEEARHRIAVNRVTYERWFGEGIREQVFVVDELKHYDHAIVRDMWHRLGKTRPGIIGIDYGRP